MLAATIVGVATALIAPSLMPQLGKQVTTRRACVATTVAALLAPPLASSAAAPSGSLIANARGFYSSWNEKKVDVAISYFADDVIFRDAQYATPFVGLEAVRAYLQECADSLPGWTFVIDDYAEDTARRKLGLRWHIEDSSKIPLPFPTNGLSFLEFDERGLIVACRDMVEPQLKAGELQLPLLRVVSRILRIT